MKKVAHLLTLLYLTCSCKPKCLLLTLASDTSHRSQTAPFISEFIFCSCSHLLDSWSLGEINPPHSPKTTLFLSPVHPWGWDALTIVTVLLWLRVSSKTIHHNTLDQLSSLRRGDTQHAVAKVTWHSCLLAWVVSQRDRVWSWADVNWHHQTQFCTIWRFSISSEVRPRKTFLLWVPCLITKWWILSWLVTDTSKQYGHQGYEPAHSWSHRKDLYSDRFRSK